MALAALALVVFGAYDRYPGDFTLIIFPFKANFSVWYHNFKIIEVLWILHINFKSLGAPLQAAGLNRDVGTRKERFCGEAKRNVCKGDATCVRWHNCVTCAYNATDRVACSVKGSI